MSSDTALSEALRTVANEHRRRLLAGLVERDTRESYTFHVSGEASNPEERNRLRTLIYHSHLPMLEDAGYVEWDRAETKLARGPQFDEIRPLIELLDEHADDLPASWP